MKLGGGGGGGLTAPRFSPTVRKPCSWYIAWNHIEIQFATGWKFMVCCLSIGWKGQDWARAPLCAYCVHTEEDMRK